MLKPPLTAADRINFSKAASHSQQVLTLWVVSQAGVEHRLPTIAATRNPLENGRKVPLLVIRNAHPAPEKM